MMSSGSGSIPSARITSRMHSFVSAKPSVGPYWSASAELSWAIRVICAAKLSGGNVEVSGSPRRVRSPPAGR